MHESVLNTYGNRLRIRVCGLLIRGDSVLMINHKHLTTNNFWAPPGGGIEFGESAPMALVREFQEECGLQIEVGDFLFACEVVRPPLHAVELFFEVSGNGVPHLGTDPELNLLTELRFMNAEELQQFPADQLHAIFRQTRNPATLPQLRGFFFG